MLFRALSCGVLNISENILRSSVKNMGTVKIITSLIRYPVSDSHRWIVFSRRLVSKSTVVLPIAHLKFVCFGFTSCISGICGMCFSDYRDQLFMVSMIKRVHRQILDSVQVLLYLFPR